MNKIDYMKDPESGVYIRRTCAHCGKILPSTVARRTDDDQKIKKYHGVCYKELTIIESLRRYGLK